MALKLAMVGGKSCRPHACAHDAIVTNLESSETCVVLAFVSLSNATSACSRTDGSKRSGARALWLPCLSGAKSRSPGSEGRAPGDLDLTLALAPHFGRGATQGTEADDVLRVLPSRVAKVKTTGGASITQDVGQLWAGC